MTETKKVAVRPSITEAEKAKILAAKGAKFKEMADKRTAKAMQYIRMLGNLASPNYVYTQEQAAKIVDALQQEVDAVFEAFKARKSKDKVTFSL